MKRPAIFFDRDNTLIVSDGYLGDPSQVVLVDGAAQAVARARSLGFAVVVFSNQAGVARGMFSEEDVHRVNARLDEMLADQDPAAVIDRHEFCPFHPEGTVDQYARESDLRKPKPGMILQAAQKLALDLSRSWVIGDAPRDIEAGKAAGCRTIWYKDPHLPPSIAANELMLKVPDAVVSSLKEAMEVIARDAAMRYAPSAESAPIQANEEPAQPEPSPRPRSSGPKSASSAKPLIEILEQKRAAAAAAAAAAVADQRQAPVTSESPSTAQLQELVEQILQELQRSRHEREREFSVSKLLAGIFQIVALAALFVAFFYQRSSPLAALLTAIFLQLFTIALLIMGKQS